MPKTGGALALASYDDIFQTCDVRPAVGEQMVQIPLAGLHPFENYPFKVRDDAAMLENVESVKAGGPILPCLVRPRNAGGYEVIAGQRDVRACELAGKDAIPAIIREMDDDTATIAMVNANLPQDAALPSELAWALRMKLEALVHRGRKVEGIDPGTLSVDILVAKTGKTKTQIYRYVHLTGLVPALMDMVDESKIAFSVAADHLYKLNRVEQGWLVDCIARYEATPSASQAIQMKKAHNDGGLTAELMDAIMAAQKKEVVRVTLSESCLERYFPASYTPKQMEEVILDLLAEWVKMQKKSA